MSEFYNGGFTTEFSVSMLKETIALFPDVPETGKWKAKLAEKYIWKLNMKSFSNETLNSSNSFIKFDVAIATWENLLKMAVLNNRLNKMDMEKIG